MQVSALPALPLQVVKRTGQPVLFVWVALSASPLHEGIPTQFSETK